MSALNLVSTAGPSALMAHTSGQPVNLLIAATSPLA
jgi:hypothetical protein